MPGPADHRLRLSGHPRRARPDRGPRPPHAADELDDGRDMGDGRDRDPVGRRSTLPEVGAPPEDRLVQATRDDQPDRDAHGRRAVPRRHHPVGWKAGQAYAWAGRAAGVAVTVVMPAGAVRSKVEACLGYGARVVLHGAHVGEAFAEMERIRDAEGLEFVHPFDDPPSSPAWLDRLRAARGPSGPRRRCRRRGGGGLDLRRGGRAQGTAPGIRVYGVEPDRSNAVTLAMERNEIVRIQPDSVADGLGAPLPATGPWR